MSNTQCIQECMRDAWKSERLIYRALEDSDADRAFVHEAIAGDPIGFALGYSEALRPQSRSMSDAIFDQLRKKGLSVVICLPGATVPKEGQETGLPLPGAGTGLGLVPIGIVTLTATAPENHHHRKTTLGISIIDSYQGGGYGPEAINWTLDWAFKLGGMHRVGITCWGYNDRAQRLYEKMGFVKEGTTRECLWLNRAWHDAVNYGMLESEWEKLRAQQKAEGE